MFIYLLSVTGVMIHMHYCGKRLESWNVYTQPKGCADDACDNSGEEDGCCKDKVVTAKVSHDQQVVSAFHVKFHPVIADVPPLLVLYVQNELVPSSLAKVNIKRANAPPGNWQHIPLYKLHTSFTYYG